MYHAHFKGTHYEAGFRWGSLLYLVSALSSHDNISGLVFAKELLSGKHGFLCQYDRNTGKDTVWSVVYDLKERRIYRTEGNPSRKKFKEDSRFKLIAAGANQEISNAKKTVKEFLK